MNEEDLLNQEDESLNISEQEKKEDIQESESIFLQNTSQEEILSPTLLALPSRRRPKEASACQYCPAAMWMFQNNILMCYCQKMSTMTYSETSEDDVKPILSCDGMYQALMEQLQEQQ